MNRNLILISTLCLAAVGVGSWLIFRDAGEPVAVALPTTPPTSEVPEQTPELSNLLSPTLRTVVSREPLGFSARKQALETLPRNLDAPAIMALTDFMNGARPEDIPTKEWHALIDQLINTLQQQDKAPPGLTSALIRMFRENEDPTLKDYSIQYLRSWYADREDFYKHEPDPDARGMILRTLLDAASKTDRPYSGTAIMALHDAMDSPDLKDEPETQRQIKALMGDYEAILIAAIEDPATNKHCKISTLQICAMRGMEQILPSARSLAADPQTDPNIRISAIAAIGRLGNLNEDAPLLNSLSKQGIRFSYAAQPALKKLARK